MESNQGGNPAQPLTGRLTIEDPSVHEALLKPLDVICRARSSRYHSRLRYLRTPHCIVYRESFRFGVEATGALPPGHYAFCVPVHLTDSARFGAQSFTEETIAFSDAGALHTTIAPGQSHVTLLVEKAFLDRCVGDAAKAELRRCEKQLQITAAKRIVRGFAQHLCRLLVLGAAFRPDPAGRPSMDQAEADICAWLASILERSVSADAPRSYRIEGLGRAMDWLYESVGHVTVQELSRAAAVSQRTLERAFADHFQQSPRQFLLDRRLHRVRRMLVRNDPDRLLVKEAALANGFYDLGRFSQYYRRRFGELPSRTLASPRKLRRDRTVSLAAIGG